MLSRVKDLIDGEIDALWGGHFTISPTVCSDATAIVSGMMGTFPSWTVRMRNNCLTPACRKWE
jgi:hypothetical protein